MGWYVIVNAKNLYFSGWRFRGSKPPLASWSNFHLAANKFHAIDSERADELCQLADALSGELMQIPDPPVDMRGEMWYNGTAIKSFDNGGLLTQADNCDIYRSPSVGASVPLAISTFPSRRGKGMAG